MNLSLPTTPRLIHFALLALSVVTLILTGPGAFSAMRTIAAAPFQLSVFAIASAEPSEPPVEPIAPPLDPDSVQPFFLLANDSGDERQAVHCLAEAVYYEAGFEAENGQRAVAQVVLNRVRDRNFPDNVCGVVYQGWTRKTGCQFSFVCDGSLVRRPPHEAQWALAKLVAEQALSGYVVAEVGSATHYHTDYVNPYWRRSLEEVAQVGTHIFYRWPGERGMPGSLENRYAGGEKKFWEEASRQSPESFARARQA